MLITINIQGDYDEVSDLRSSLIADMAMKAKIASPDDHIVVSINAVDSFVSEPARPEFVDP